jgi:hypothetical protein
VQAGLVAIVLLLACSRTDAGPAAADGVAADPRAGEAIGQVGSTVASSARSGAAEAEPVEDPTPPPPPDAAEAGACPEKADDAYGILVTPDRPHGGAPLRVIAATFEGEDPLALRVETDDGKPVEADLEFLSGVPAATIATVAKPASGRLRIVTGRGGQGKACLKVEVGRSAGPRRPPGARSDAVWPVSRSWDAGEEALFSAWVRKMFRADRGEELAWKQLDRVTSDADRNVLFDHFGWGEDEPDPRAGLYLKPDCADAPYFLRAYFSWKRRLPFGFRQCSRGRDKAPHCGALRSVVGPPADPPDAAKPGELGQVQRYFRKTLAWGVHSGNGRTPFGTDETDFYPLKLARRALRPGATYADPYGHLFVVVELVAPQGSTPGVLYAIDGQPDGSITRKRFWEGNFLWNPDPALGGSGFKAFRPLDLRRTPDGLEIVPVTDAQIAARRGYGDVSDEQSKLTADAFYDTMDALITPGKRDPFVAQEEAVQALFEAAKVRVTSVHNAEDFKAKRGGEIAMPDGHAIFETTGAWENYSTPARDLRLLIAIDLVQGFDRKVARNPSVYRDGGRTMAELREALAQARQRLLADERTSFQYTRSDGSKWTLTLAELVDRAAALEMAYNPNDCVELRWGAPAGSEERKTCRQRASEAQQRKMAAYRPWFAERRRPARGDTGPPVK